MTALLISLLATWWICAHLPDATPTDPCIEWPGGSTHGHVMIPDSSGREFLSRAWKDASVQSAELTPQIASAMDTAIRMIGDSEGSAYDVAHWGMYSNSTAIVDIYFHGSTYTIILRECDGGSMWPCRIYHTGVN
jgi:hypothetical protein